MSVQILNYVANDTLPELECVYTDVSGDVVDITGYAFELHIGYEPTPLTIVGSIVDASLGTFKFEYVAGNLISGTWLAEIQVTNSASKIITFQNLKYEIKPEIA